MTHIVKSIDAGGVKRSIKGILHREDGPAVEYPNGTKMWFIDGELHRIDGPAIECPNGVNGWYLRGKNMSEEKWLFHVGEK